MSPPITLLSLPNDVLHEILSNLLLSPVAPQRASILRTCSLLNFIGLPLLYRVVDLTGYNRSNTNMVWKTCFGGNGLFSENRGQVRRSKRKGGPLGSRKVEGAWVRELSLDTGSHRFGLLDRTWVVNNLSLPNCSTLALRLFSISHSSKAHLTSILKQLPINHLRLERTLGDDERGRGLEQGCRERVWEFLGLESPPWPNLSSIELVDVLFYEIFFGLNPHWVRHLGDGLALRTYPLRNVVVRLDPLRFKSALYLYRNLFKAPNGSYPNVERIEMQVAIEIERDIRREREEREGTGLNALERRLGPLVVFVDEDGTERRLVGE